MITYDEPGLWSGSRRCGGHSKDLDHEVMQNRGELCDGKVMYTDILWMPCAVLKHDR